MKKTIFTILYTLAAVSVMAGGIVTNTNQSASFIRNPAQDATKGISSAYYNPAGMTQLKDGFHLSLNNQFVKQTRFISVQYPDGFSQQSGIIPLNNTEFKGTVTAPLFPSAYAVFKKNKFAFSLAFNPIGGGGSATYENGLPSFESPVAAIPLSLTAGGIPTNKYSFESEFEGSSIYYGLQAGAAYQISDVISLSLGVRYVMINNQYKGYLRNIQINPMFPALGYTGNMVGAPSFFNSMADMFTGLAGVAESLQPLVDGGGAGLTLSQAQAMGFLTAEQVASIAGGFALIDPNIDPMLLNIAQIQGAYGQASPEFRLKSMAMGFNADATSDKEVDAIQTGTGIVPVVGLNLNFHRINFGIKYEHKATIKVKNSTKVDDVGLFPDKLEVASDIPSLLSLGFSFNATNRLNISAGYHTYFDKNADYGKTLDGALVANKEVIDKNLWEFAFGLEYWLTKKLLFSAGYLVTETGVNLGYQTDLDHSLSTFSFGGGFLYKATDAIDLNLGALRTYYNPITKNMGGYGEAYDRKSVSIAIGVDFHF